jgi:outer membrane protein
VIRKKVLMSGALILALFVFVVRVNSAEMKIGYIDSQRILATYPPAVDAQKELEGESAKWGQELQKMNQEFKTLQEQLDQQSLLLSEEKKRERAQELQNLAMKIQQYQNEKWGEQGEFFNRREELLKPVFDQINEAIKKVGADDDYDYIFDTVAGNILHAKEKYDLTDRILDELEKISSSASSKSGG